MCVIFSSIIPSSSCRSASPGFRQENHICGCEMVPLRDHQCCSLNDVFRGARNHIVTVCSLQHCRCVSHYLFSSSQYISRPPTAWVCSGGAGTKTREIDSSRWHVDNGCPWASVSAQCLAPRTSFRMECSSSGVAEACGTLPQLSDEMHRLFIALGCIFNSTPMRSFTLF